MSLDTSLSLLPVHKKEIEKALDVLSKNRFEGLAMERLTNLVKSCPKELLPILAMSFDVDIEGFSEKESRKLIESAFELHFYSGTHYAVEKALLSVFSSAKIKRAWEDPTLRAHEFDVVNIIAPDSDIIDAKKIEVMKKVIGKVKSARDLLRHMQIEFPDFFAKIVEITGVGMRVDLDVPLVVQPNAKEHVVAAAFWKI